MTTDAVRDQCRSAVAARGLTPVAVAYLVQDALGRVDLERLAPVKRLLKQFFSDEVWSAGDEESLAALVGPGDGWWVHELDGGFGFAFGWRDGAFRIELSHGISPSAVGEDLDGSATRGESFLQSVVPEATPNPRTVRFVTGPIHDGPSRWYESAADVDDPRVARLFEGFDDVANVLVGPDFVAVGLRHPDRWSSLLDGVLRVVAEAFASGTEDRSAPGGEATPSSSRRELHTTTRTDALDGAWRRLGRLRPSLPDELAEIVSAASSTDTAERQVAARLLVDAEAGIALSAWERLLGDKSRSVRRATVDAMVDAERLTLRPLLERALLDDDAWIRWKALRGLVVLGGDPSRAAIERIADDADFRVRLEANRVLRPRSNL